MEISLTMTNSTRGTAWLRTNLGQAKVRYSEIINKTEQHLPPIGRDWLDLPMKMVNSTTYAIRLPLLEVGVFQAKAYFLPAHQRQPVWPAGDDMIIKVDPADYICANVIYNSFVRQFGPNKFIRSEQTPQLTRCIESLDDKGYTVIPPSGVFRGLIAELDFIIGKLGCRIIQLLPIHPTPTVYGRMGRFGSAFASLDFMDVDPALAEFDKHHTPMDQFIELVDGIHAHHAKLFLDLAINHTGWGSKLHIEHPEWFARNDDGAFRSPGAWGVVWEDLIELDYDHYELWEYMAEVFLYWCRRGVDGFRCDAGYKVPVPVWEYIVAKVRNLFPDTVFILEGLGGKISVTRELLIKANLNWAYSELFQNYDRQQVSQYLLFAAEISKHEGLLIHFAETHDNNRLAGTSSIHARVRTALSALCSHAGGFAFANGVEWYASEKISVHDACSLNWNAAENQVDFIARLNLLLRHHPNFYPGAQLTMVQESDSNVIAVYRDNRTTQTQLLILINLDHHQANEISWQRQNVNMDHETLVDLITDRAVAVKCKGKMARCQLAAGESLCLTQSTDPYRIRKNFKDTGMPDWKRNVRQRLQSEMLTIYTAIKGSENLPESSEFPRLIATLERDPPQFCRDLIGTSCDSRIVFWQWPRDLRREVMIPPGHWLYIHADNHFRVQLYRDKSLLLSKSSLPERKNRYFVLLPAQPVPDTMVTLEMAFTVYTSGVTAKEIGYLILLPSIATVKVNNTYSHRDKTLRDISVLATNNRGAMMLVNGSWGRLINRYQCLLAANLNSLYPDDRHVMLTRYRIWVVFQGYSIPINDTGFETVQLLNNGSWQAAWHFRIPVGNGRMIILHIHLGLVAGKNVARMRVRRMQGADGEQDLPNGTPVEIIIRPDIEDRNFHQVTKAYSGPEHDWPQVIVSSPLGFTFVPAENRQLKLQSSGGKFHLAPEWQYMIDYPVDRERGLDPNGDLYSPGYFSLDISGGEEINFWAEVITSNSKSEKENSKHIIPSETGISSDDNVFDSPIPLAAALKNAMCHYLVVRGSYRSVIAGYPWFLDWGRDTLICARGMIAAGLHDDVKLILQQFAEFEDHGTLPNMIRGQDTGNRDTSDAPLWLIVATADWCECDDGRDILATRCGKRTLAQVIASIIAHYIEGTPNGIRMDPASGLIYSPSHFTWMDTNHPAGSPRQGYPIEIQALWYASLMFAGKVWQNRDWIKLSRRVQSSLHKYYFVKGQGYLSDCLHAQSGKVSAAKAIPDDALRPNQLLAITLKAIKDSHIREQCVSACAELLVPGGIRSLADRRVSISMPVYRNEQLLNDPFNPYWGNYLGDEDTRRKPAYHNGTAWTWQFPSYCEAWHLVYGERGRETAMALLGSVVREMNRGCLGQIPEILDGNYPHTARGCPAQAWGVTESYRVLKKISEV